MSGRRPVRHFEAWLRPVTNQHLAALEGTE